MINNTQMDVGGLTSERLSGRQPTLTGGPRPGLTGGWVRSNNFSARLAVGKFRDRVTHLRKNNYHHFWQF